MGWQLIIYNPAFSAIKQSCSDSAPAGVVGGFEWEVKPNGDCVQLRFSVRADAMSLLEDDRVGFWEGGAQVFYGSVAALPDPYDENEKTVTVLGARESLKLIFPARRRYSNVTDLASVITREAASPIVVDPAGYRNGRAGYKSVLPAHITYNAAQIESNLGTMRVWDFALTKLDQILDRIAASATGASGPVSWGVNANRELFLKSDASAQTPASYTLERLERSSEGIVTRVVVPVAQNPSAAFTKFAPISVNIAVSDSGWAFVGDPIVIDVQDPAHATYNRTQDVALGLIDPLGKMTIILNGTGFEDVGFANDGNPSSWATSNVYASPYQLTIGGTITTGYDQAVAFDLTYSTSLKTHVCYLDVSWVDSSLGNVPAAFKVVLPGTGNHEINRVRLYAKLDLGVADRVDFSFTKLDNPVAFDEVRIYELSVLKIASSATQYAKSFIKLPEPVIARAVIPGRFGPFPLITLAGATYKASAYRYKLVELEGVVGLETVVDIGQRVQSQTARVLNSAMRELDRRNVADNRAYVDSKTVLL